jgi:hypothetical protein
MDKSQIPGTGEWLFNQAQKTAAGRYLLNPQNPALEGGIAQAFGTGVGGSMFPGAGPAQLLMGGLSAMAGNKVGELTGSPELAMTASMLPSGVAHYAPDITKSAALGVRPWGSDLADAQKAMAQRVADLNTAGVTNPTLGLATGNPVIQGIESILDSTPGAIGVMSRARNAARQSLQSTAQDTADLAAGGQPTGRTEAGTAIQQGIGQFRNDFKTTQRDLYENQLAPLVPNTTPVNLRGTLDTLSGLNATTPGWEATTAGLRNPALVKLESNMRADLARNQPQPGGLLNQPPADPLMPWAATKGLRTSIGDKMAENPILADMPRKMLDPVYASLSGNMRDAAQAAGGQPALDAFNRANNYTSTGLAKIQTMEPFEGAVRPGQEPPPPENAYDRYVKQAANRGSLTTLQTVKEALPPDARGQIAGTVIENLGTLPPNQQDAFGEGWSSERFLTRYGQMDPQARNELFSGFPNADEVRAKVDAIARASSYMREGGKLWNNPSGTAMATAARGLLATTAVGFPAAALGFVPWAAPFGAVGAMGAANVGARLATSPSVRNWVQGVPSPTAYTQPTSLLATTPQPGLLSAVRNLIPRNPPEEAGRVGGLLGTMVPRVVVSGLAQ